MDSHFPMQIKYIYMPINYLGRGSSVMYMTKFRDYMMSRVAINHARAPIALT